MVIFEVVKAQAPALVTRRKAPSRCNAIDHTRTPGHALYATQIYYNGVVISATLGAAADSVGAWPRSI